MYDQPLFLQTLSRFAVVLPPRYDLESALAELTQSVTAVLGGPRKWSDEDISVAAVLADVATSYVVNASKLRQQQQLTEQLQQALDSRVVIEQAKGITAQQNSITVTQAYQLMRGHARNNNAGLRMVAEAIVSVGLQV